MKKLVLENTKPFQGLAELVAYNEGLFAKNKTEWINTIKYLFQEKQIRLNMGNAARKKIIEFYSKELIFDKLINNIRKMKLI